MRFTEYFKERLDEKVNQREIEEALNNRNIIIGGEFEFTCEILTEWEGDDSTRDMYDDAYSAWEEWHSDYKDYDNEKYELENEVSELEDKMYEYEDSEEEFDKDKFEEYKNLRDEKQEELDDLEFPSVPMAYSRYIDHINDNYYAGFYYNKHDLPEPQSPDDFENDLSSESSWEQAMEDSYDDIFGDCPVKGNIKVVTDSKYSSYTNWMAVYDGSIAVDGGIELVSPPMPLPEFMELCPKILAWITRKGGTNSNCGFHVHMSINGVRNLKGVIDPVKLSLMTDEGYIWKYFEGREFNNYCQNTKKTLAQRGISSSDVEKLINKQKLSRDLGEDHYHSINFEHWEKGRIEFRQMGGDSYDKKWSRIKPIIAQHAHVLSIACDTTWKQQEYSVRLARMANKLDNLRLLIYTQWLEGTVKDIDTIYGEKYSLLSKAIRMEINNVNRGIVGGLPDKDMEMHFRNNAEFMKNIAIYKSSRLKEISNKVKIELPAGAV